MQQKQIILVINFIIHKLWPHTDNICTTSFQCIPRLPFRRQNGYRALPLHMLKAPGPDTEKFDPISKGTSSIHPANSETVPQNVPRQLPSL